MNYHKNICKNCKNWVQDPAAPNIGVCWYYFDRNEENNFYYYLSKRWDEKSCHKFIYYDSWENLEKDCELCDIDYCNKYGLLSSDCNALEGDGAIRHCSNCNKTCSEIMAHDLVCRAKELAEIVE